jgi:hypothetical protein
LLSVANPFGHPNACFSDPTNAVADSSWTRIAAAQPRTNGLAEPAFVCLGINRNFAAHYMPRE